MTWLTPTWGTWFLKELIQAIYVNFLHWNFTVTFWLVLSLTQELAKMTQLNSKFDDF